MQHISFVQRIGDLLRANSKDRVRTSDDVLQMSVQENRALERGVEG